MIVLAIGSNLSSNFGDRFENIDSTILHLENYGIKVLKKSSFYETPSYPDKQKPKFINVVTQVESNLPPVDLVSVLLFIENKLERKRDKKNDPRTCDIDLIDYKNQILNFKYKNLDFAVPHKKIGYRNFVLFPLQEICPEWKHPETNEKIGVLISKLNHEDKISILKVEKN